MRVPAFLQDLPAAWEAAPPQQRNALTRIILTCVEILDGQVVAVARQSDVALFFNLAEVETRDSLNDEGQPN